jgi:hypothetical protein
VFGPCESGIRNPAPSSAHQQPFPLGLVVIEGHGDAACVQKMATPPTPPWQFSHRLSSPQQRSLRAQISAKCHQSTRPTTYQDRMAEFTQPHRSNASNFAVHPEPAPQPIALAVIQPLEAGKSDCFPETHGRGAEPAAEPRPSATMATKGRLMNARRPAGSTKAASWQPAANREDAPRSPPLFTEARPTGEAANPAALGSHGSRQPPIEAVAAAGISNRQQQSAAHSLHSRLSFRKLHVESYTYM